MPDDLHEISVNDHDHRPHNVESNEYHSHGHHNQGDHRPACNHHDHSHADKPNGHVVHLHNHHDHHHKKPVADNNHGLLKWGFSKASVTEGDWLHRHRRKIVLGAAGAMAAFEYGTTGAMSTNSQLAMVFGTAMLAHDSSEDLMESVNDLKESHHVNSGAIGMAIGAVHTGAEFLLAAFAKAGSYSDMVVATTMGSHVSHIPLMVGVSALVGAISIDRLSAYKMNSVAIASVTSAFGYQIATGEFNPYLSASMVGGGLGYIRWRMKAGQTCEIHCSSCGHVHSAPDETDYISMSHWRDVAKKTTVPSRGQALESLNQNVKSLGKKLSSLSLPKPREIYTRLQNFGKSTLHPNILKLGNSLVALGLSAHILGNNVVKIAQEGAISTTAMGVSVAALAFALPELILTGKAAWKKDGEMAWGAITGCTVATVAIVGGYQGLSDFEVPESLSLAITEGKVQMTAFLGSAAAIIAATHPKVAKNLAKLDNVAANLFENKLQGVSNWLRNDGTKISKVAAAPMLAAALAFYTANIVPICHSHGTWVHCFNPVDGPLPSANIAHDILNKAIPQRSGPDF